ncbi:MAG TPA: hypothetical protein PLX79_04505, partial [Candidatus Dojkabacteria bacterium]|nr:hypothetical protein [Candidatus Dojkabacteria bacterium]
MQHFIGIDNSSLDHKIRVVDEKDNLKLSQDHARHLNKLHFAIRQYYPLQESLFVDFACTVHLKMI